MPGQELANARKRLAIARGSNWRMPEKRLAIEYNTETCQGHRLAIRHRNQFSMKEPIQASQKEPVTASPSGKTRSLTIPIIIVSIAIPVAVAFIILVPQVKIDFGFNTSFLPLFHAILNSSTAILLIASLYFIKNGLIKAHKAANLAAVVLSSIFLVSYVIYHASNPSTRFGDLNHDGILSDAERQSAGALRYVYYFFLSSHIILSGVIIPLVLFTLQKAFQEKFDKHRKLARITWPIWLYVAVTGVVVYLMISPYY